MVELEKASCKDIECMCVGRGERAVRRERLEGGLMSVGVNKGLIQW